MRWATESTPLADAVSFDLGASLGMPAITAHRCLFSDGPLEPGAAVLVYGGAGAVGHYAIELASRAGAAVCATVSSDDKARLAAAAGAQLVVNYRSDDVATALREWVPAACGGSSRSTPWATWSSTVRSSPRVGR